MWERCWRDRGSGQDRYGQTIGVTGNLPAAQVEGLQTGIDHLDSLSAGHGAKGSNAVLGQKKVPQTLGSRFSQRVLYFDAAPQFCYVGGSVVPLDPLPSGVVSPALL